MKVVHHIEDIPLLTAPIALSIGVFDGMHLGHQYLISQAKKHGPCAVITFPKHPLETLQKKPIPLLLPFSQKLSLLEKAGVDLVVALDFTPQFAALTYEEFLRRIAQTLPFSQLILGKGSAFGKRREGTEENVTALAPQLGFTPHYLEKKQFQEKKISTSVIKNLIAQGDLAHASELLGRPYSLILSFDQTRAADVSHLVLPPEGTYFISIDGSEIKAILTENRLLLPNDYPLPTSEVEVIFHNPNEEKNV